MKILDKFKKIIQTKTVVDSDKDLQCIILNKLFSEKDNLNKKPEDLSEEDWKKEIDSMIFSFRTSRSSFLKSPTRKKSRELRLQKGFDSFIKYYSQL